MYVVTLDQNDLTWLAFAAGIAAGSGNQTAHASLFGIISRIQPLEDTDGTLPPEQGYPDDEPVAEDFRGTVDPMFMPPAPTPPSRPTDEFGAGRGRGGVTGTPLA